MIVTNLLTNMIVLTLSGVIPTNTPAFKEYAFNTIMTNAQALALKWHLNDSLIASNKVTHFDATPHPEGLSAGITFDDRYIFGSNTGDPIGFTDKGYYVGYLTNHTQWMHETNLLTFKKAQQIAESAMVAYGIPVKQIGFKKPVKKEQLKWIDDKISYKSNGWTYVETKEHPKTYPLPYYEFEWETRKANCVVHVSGISSNIVSFSFGWRYLLFPDFNHLRLVPPTNYFEILGLPTNTILVKRRWTPTGVGYEAIPSVEKTVSKSRLH